MAGMKYLEERAYDAVDRGLIPDFLLRIAVRTLTRIRLRSLSSPSSSSHAAFSTHHEQKQHFIHDLRTRPTIAEQTDKANEQHYEVSTRFMMMCLGPRAKYSACLWDGDLEKKGKNGGGIKEAEERMLDSYCVKARMRDGLDVLDLGCGWGSLTLYLAEKYPKSRIVGLSNSNTQREHILGVAKEKGLSNVEVITADVNTFDFTDGRTFDRIFSIEMFEHMKNYELLLRKVSTWMRPKVKGSASPSVKLRDGHALPNGDDVSKNESDHKWKEEEEEESLLFVHIFCHKTTPYHFEDDDGWMAKTFFSGGTMPSHDLLLYFQSDVTLLRSWFVNGKHYSRTLEAWLQLQDQNAKEGLAELERDAKAKGMDPAEGRKAFYRFRLFYIACSEFFGLNEGEEWGVGHYLFKRKD